MKNVIEVKNLVKKYRNAKKNAVDDISFSVSEGQFFAFLGPNGAGKTTTISILTTTLAPTSGKITIAGYDIEKQASHVRHNIGVIFQNPSLDKNLTAEENIRFHTILYGLYPFRPTFSLMPESYRKRVSELSEVLGLKNDIYKPIKTFSGGMKRKLEIIRSLMHKPKVLFLDEPTSGLDPISRANLWEYLREVRKTEKTTIFLTTHYLEEAEDADIVAVINKGKIITHGTPEKIKKHLVQEYIIMDAKDRDVLRKELTKHKFTHTENGIFTIFLDHHSPQKIIQSIHTPLTTLQIHTPSLEDAYVKIIEQENKEE